MAHSANNQQRERGRAGHGPVRRTGQVLSLIACLMLLAGCQVLDTNLSNRYTIEMQDTNRFDPGTIEVERGATIVFHNQSQIWHSATTDPGTIVTTEPPLTPEIAALWDSGNIDPGESWSIRLDEPGTYLFYCRRHAEQGMIGSITVLE